MRKGTKKGVRRRRLWILLGCGLFLGTSVWVVFFPPTMHPWWKTLTRESRRVLGGAGETTFPEEDQIRKELIVKRMEEASLHRDWRGLAPEYPHSPKNTSSDEKEVMRSIKESNDFIAMDRDVKDYLKKKENLIFHWEPPLPPLGNPIDATAVKDKGTTEVIQRLLSTKEKVVAEKPLRENVELGIKGALISRNILERPDPPQVKVRVEAELELTFWVSPNGTVDRVVPSVRGDAELERIAIGYLKQWRFAPLPSGKDQVIQEGSIPIRFKLK